MIDNVQSNSEKIGLIKNPRIPGDTDPGELIFSIQEEVILSYNEGWHFVDIQFNHV